MQPLKQLTQSLRILAEREERYASSPCVKTPAKIQAHEKIQRGELERGTRFLRNLLLMNKVELGNLLGEKL